MGRNKKRRGPQAVELNLAAMLDMAFQLLTFFILTFRPAPVEGEIAMRMTPAASPSNTTVRPGAEFPPTADPSGGLDSLAIRVTANPQGGIDSLAIEDQSLGIENLDGRLKSLLADRNNVLKQIVIQAGSNLHYDSLMNVVDKCARQKLAGGEPLKKIRFVEFADGKE